MGANGILLNGFGSYQVGSDGVVVVSNSHGRHGTTGFGAMNPGNGEDATGVAIFVQQP